MTPGREEYELETKLYTKKDLEATKQENTASKILSALGGADNIQNLDCCATRLRIKLKDCSQFDEQLIKETGAAGVIKKDDSLQIVYGPRVSVIKSELEEWMESSKN